MLRANLLTVALDEVHYASGFGNAGVSVTAAFSLERFGAGVYAAYEGEPIWPYHYHHGIEEWLLVLSGEPVLREPAGRRTLAAGDLIAFPSGRAGAHTVEGPGRFVMFSAGSGSGPVMGVFPDSDKVSGPEGMMLRGPAVRYWHGEGTGALDADLGERGPLVLDGPPRPTVNLETIVATPPYPVTETPEGFRHANVKLGPLIGASQLGATLFEIDPGEGTAPYHYEFGCEEAVLVLSGTPTLRHPDGEALLVAGDLVCFTEGPAGAHRLVNRGPGLVRLVVLSTKGWPCSVCYPDSGKWALLNGPGGAARMFRSSDAAGYWDGEI